jgi:hypothetical protein
MGFVQPTEGYMNFRWLSSLSGTNKVRGAWFDHIECSAQNFVDQAYQSVLAGARELTLFHLGDLMEGHSGDKLLAERLPDLFGLAAKVQRHAPSGIAYYNPPNSQSEDNMYLADYLAMLGLPVLPEAAYPATASVVILPVQAAFDGGILNKVERQLESGTTFVLTPALIRALGNKAGRLAGVMVGPQSVPRSATKIVLKRTEHPLTTPLEIDAAVTADEAEVEARALVEEHSSPLLTCKTMGQSRIYVLNVRTFSEQDFQEHKEWLLAPKQLGLPVIPQPLVDTLRAALLFPLKIEWQAPVGVTLYLFGDARCVYNFNDQKVPVRLGNKALELEPHQCLWFGAQ